MENNVRVGTVKFNGLCLNCGKMLDITEFLTVEEKQKLVKKQEIIHNILPELFL